MPVRTRNASRFPVRSARPSASRTPPKPKPPSFNKPHMIELPLAAALLDLYGDDAEAIIERLSSKKSWDLTELSQVMLEERVRSVYNSKLILSATMILAPNVAWTRSPQQSHLVVDNIHIPDSLSEALLGESVARLVEHPWLPASMTIKEISWRDGTPTVPGGYKVRLAETYAGIRHALRVLRNR